MNEILETIGIAAVRISHLETQLAAAAEIERLRAENAALRAVLAAELSLFDSEIDDRLAQVQP